MRKEEFICSAELSDLGKVDYYILYKSENECTQKSEWGIKVVFNKDEAKIEYFSEDYKKVKEILYILCENKVTPVTLFDIIYDLFI